MDTQSGNPLSQYFRQPAIYYKLPSNGKFWPDGSLNLPVTGELPVLPLTTRDEITLRTPDALLNGAGVVSVVQSCCPSIIDAWKMPSIDVDATLIAIRIASYGETMDVEVKCPHCNEKHEYSVNLPQVLETITTPDFSKTVNINGISIRLKPQPYFSINTTNKISFEEERIIKSISDESITDDERVKVFNEHLQRLIDLNLKIMVDSTESITGSDGTVITSSVFINELYQKSDRKVVKAVKDWLEKAAAEVAIKPVKTTCVDCQKDIEIVITFDYANFFA